MTVTVTRSDDINLTVTLQEDGSFKNITGAEVKASIVSKDGTQSYATATQSAATPGANYALGVVVVLIPAASTTTLPAGPVTLEIQVDVASEKLTWYDDSLLSRIGSIA